MQLNLVLIAVIVLTTTFAVFVWRQTRYYRHDLRTMQPAATAIIQSYNQEKPTVDAFVAKVAEYARSHPDFEPIARKYQLHLVTNLPPAAVKPAAAPAPAPKK